MFLRFSIFFSFLILAVTNCTAHEPIAEPSSVNQGINGVLDETKQRFGIVGYSAVILRNGETIHTRSDGLASIELNAPVTEETVFQVFSVAKLFVHTTIMQLHENGAIDLDAGIGHYLTDLPEAWRDITVRQLLSHESGLPDYYRWPDHQTPKDAEEALALAETLPSFFPTGTSARYTQTNYLLLGLLIEQQTGEPFRAAMASRMMEPSSLKNTAYGGEFAVIPGRATMYRSTEDGVRRNLFIDQPDYMFASTGLNSTASDLAKWFQHLLAGEFLSPSTLDAMWTPLDSEDGRKPRFLNGWEYTKCKDGTVVVGHGGGNRADVRHFTRGDESVTIVFLSNGSAVDFWPGQISFDLAEIVFADE